MNLCEICGVEKSFRGDGKRLTVLKKVDLTVSQGTFTVITGRSGSGKTTLLRIIAGLEPPDEGVVRITASRIGVVFQEPRLMPWLTVRQNAAFLVDKISDAGIDSLLESVGLREVGDAFPHELSGGMKQRTALARALALSPDLLLMDEPFVSLDAFTRREMQDLLLKMCALRKIAVIFVTHDLTEALRLADKICVLKNGYIVRSFPAIGKADDLPFLKKEILAVL